MRTLRVVVVARQEPWPLDSGGRLHLYHLLRELASHAEVTLALPHPPEYAPQLPPGLTVELLRPDPDERSYATPPHPNWVERWARRHFGFDPAIAGWLARQVRPQRFDIAILAGAVLGQYAGHCAVPVIWDLQDELVLPVWRAAEHAGPRRWPAAARTGLLHALYERQAARRAAATVFVSPVDARYARGWTAGSRLAVIQNGVDGEYFRPPATAPRPGTVAFVGALDFPPNIDGILHFAQHIWPAIHDQRPRRRLLVVGRRPVQEVLRLRARPGVEVHADVPDVRPYLAAATVVVVPVRQGTGLKNKVLEACAMGRPVVASPRALAGLRARLGVDVLVATTPRSWRDQVGRLLNYPDRADAVGRRGRTWVRGAHRWSDTGRRYLELLADVCGLPPGSAAPATVAADAPAAKPNGRSCAASDSRALAAAVVS